MPKTGARTRAVKKDAVLEAAVNVARAGAEAVAYPRPVGEHVGFEMVSERLATHFSRPRTRGTWAGAGPSPSPACRAGVSPPCVKST